MYCQLELAIFYLSVTILIAIVCFVACLTEWIHRPGHKAYKGMMYAGFGVSLLIPLGHMVINEVFFDNFGDPFAFTTAVPYIALLGASYLGGVYIYVIRCPERRRPGKHNVCGHSHQIWHGCVVLGIFFTYLGALKAFEMRKVSVCPV
jgi:adiponectin receptor